MRKDTNTRPAIPTETGVTPPALPDPAPCTPWCMVPEHREPGWADGEVSHGSGGRTCSQTIGTVTWPIYDSTLTGEATVFVERFQYADSDPQQADIYPAAVRVTGGVGGEDALPVDAARKIAALLTIAADRAEVGR